MLFNDLKEEYKVSRVDAHTVVRRLFFHTVILIPSIILASTCTRKCLPSCGKIKFHPCQKTARQITKFEINYLQFSQERYDLFIYKQCIVEKDRLQPVGSKLGMVFCSLNFSKKIIKIVVNGLRCLLLVKPLPTSLQNSGTWNRTTCTFAVNGTLSFMCACMWVCKSLATSIPKQASTTF